MGGEEGCEQITGTGLDQQENGQGMLTPHSLVDKQSLALVCLDNGRVKSSKAM